MTTGLLNGNSILLVASRGTEPQHGLHAFTQLDGVWSGRQIGHAVNLSTLAAHPSLPVIYGAGADGTLHAWTVSAEGGAALPSLASGGGDPCHVSVDPTGSVLVATNYETSNLTLVRLAADGSFAGAPAFVALTGTGPETDRQEAAHPHQSFFADGLLHVVDLGADLVRRYRLDLSQSGAAMLVDLGAVAAPPGTGPRHGVALPDGRLAVSGELGSTIILGADTGWTSAPASAIPGPAKTRHTRNYPGDIQRSADGRFAYLANRSHDSIATFDVTGATPVMVGEVDTAVAWPQHLLVLGDHILVAGWDSSRVVALPLVDGLPQSSETLFAVENPTWLLPHDFRA